jgi:hypothetical protein
MKRLATLLAIGFALTIQAQSWTVATPPEEVTIDGLRVDFIGLTVETNMTARGILVFSKTSGSNMVSRVTLPLSPGAVSNILATCGTTLPQLGGLLLGLGGLTPGKDFVRSAAIAVDSRTGKATVRVTTMTNQQRIIPEDTVNGAMMQAGGGVEIFQRAFLDHVKKNIK